MEPLPGTEQEQEAPGAEQLPPHLEASPVPGCVPVRWPLQVPELDLIGSVCAPDIHRELHLQELVSLLPLNLNVAAEGCHHGGLTGRDCISHVLVCSSQSMPATTKIHQSPWMNPLPPLSLGSPSIGLLSAEHRQQGTPGKKTGRGDIIQAQGSAP